MSGARSIQPVTLREANAWIEQHHRHSDPVRGHRLSLGLFADDELLGVAVIGRTVARALHERTTAEVLRVCTLPAQRLANGHTDVMTSRLYAASWRVWRAWGGRRLVTYTLQSESGHALRAAGFREVERLTARPAGWPCPSRPERKVGLLDWEPKIRWEHRDWWPPAIEMQEAA